MIGKRWMEPKGSVGLRLNDPKDFVRIEIAAALSRDIRVIPVLLEGAIMPTEDALPEPLRALARRNALEVSNTRFDADLDRLIDAVSKVLGGRDVRGARGVRSRRAMLAWALGGLVAIAGVPAAGLVLSRMRSETPPRPVSAQADWRFCRKCHSLFFDGYPGKGVCAAGGGGASVEGPGRAAEGAAGSPGAAAGAARTQAAKGPAAQRGELGPFRERRAAYPERADASPETRALGTAALADLRAVVRDAGGPEPPVSSGGGAVAGPGGSSSSPLPTDGVAGGDFRSRARAIESPIRLGVEG